MRTASALLALSLVCIAASAHAGANTGTSAWLSWSATSQVNDTAPAATNKLFVRLTRSSAISWKGGELDLTWDPASDFGGCFDHIGTVYKTSAGTTCTYLNRGSAVPVATADDERHFHLAWANTIGMTSCSAGTCIEVDFETDTCADPTGCLSLNSMVLLDVLSLQDVATIANGIVTVGGGGSHRCGAVTPAEPATWGTVKALYAR